MKKLALVLCASMLLAAPAYAQSPDAAPPPGAGPGGGGDTGGPGGPGGSGPGAGPGAGGGGKGGGKMKEIMQACRTEAKDKGLKGKELRQAAMDCAIKQKPAMADRLKCRMEGKDKGLKPGDEMKSFIKECMHKNG